MTQQRLVVGCMTGTSLDALDAVLTRITGDGLSIKATLVSHWSRPFSDELRHGLLEMARGTPTEPLAVLRSARALGELHADALGELSHDVLSETGESAIDFACCHGQTVWHAGNEGLSWQLFDPWPIVQRFRIPVCYDLRQADLIAGGQGAPITPLSDWVMYRDHGDLIVNLGGVMNITWLTPASQDITGGDCAPCNLLVDSVAIRIDPSLRYDVDGAMARAGKPIPALVEVMRNALGPEYANRSLGREDFNQDWIDQWWPATDGHAAPDIVASAVQTVATWLADALREAPKASRVILAGGGAHNPALVDAITAEIEAVASASGLDHQVRKSDAFGIPVDAREAMGFAVLGALCQDGAPITVPVITGASRLGIAGTWAGMQ